MKKKSKSKNLFEIFPSEEVAPAASENEAQSVEDLFSLDLESFDLTPLDDPSEPEETPLPEPLDEPVPTVDPEPEQEPEQEQEQEPDPLPSEPLAETPSEPEPEPQEETLPPPVVEEPIIEPVVEPAPPTLPAAEPIVDNDSLSERIAYINQLSPASNQALLVEIAATDPNIEVCKAALKRLSSREVIMQVASSYRKQLQGATGATKTMYEELFRFLCENCIRKIRN